MMCGQTEQRERKRESLFARKGEAISVGESEGTSGMTGMQG